MRYPFLFYVETEEEGNQPEGQRLSGEAIGTAAGKYVVIIGKGRLYHWYNCAWIDRSSLGESCLRPTVDHCESEHIFDTEEKALDFIRNWWIKEGAE